MNISDVARALGKQRWKGVPKRERKRLMRLISKLPRPGARHPKPRLKTTTLLEGVSLGVSKQEPRE